MVEMVPIGEEIGYELIPLRKVIDQLELKFSRLAAEFVKTEFWEDQGSASPYDWVRFNCHMTSNAAGDRVAVGELASNLPESIQALDDGEIGFAHLTVMARTANAVGQAFDETKLLKLAHENSPGKFHYKCLHYRHSVSPKKYSDEQAALVHSNFLYMNRGDDGSFFLTGSLDPVGGAVVRNALEPLARYSGKDDHRLRPQRMADALVELAGHKTKIQMQVTSSIETLLDLTGAPGAETEFSLPISSKTVERWACDCSLTRVLLQDSVVIDVSRAEPTIRGPKRRAPIARDRHRRWPGCERPAPWGRWPRPVYVLDGGGDELENLVLLCTRHHRMGHAARWQLIKNQDRPISTIAPTVT